MEKKEKKELVQRLIAEYENSNSVALDFNCDELKEILEELRSYIKGLVNLKRTYEKARDTKEEDKVKERIKLCKYIENELMNYKKKLYLKLQNQVPSKPEEKKKKTLLEIMMDLDSDNLLSDEEKYMLELYELEEDHRVKLEVLEKIKLSLEIQYQNLNLRKQEEIKLFIDYFNSRNNKKLRFNEKKSIYSFLQQHEYESFNTKIDLYNELGHKIKTMLEKICNQIGLERNILASESRALNRQNSIEFASNDDILEEFDIEFKKELYTVLYFIESLNVDNLNSTELEENYLLCNDILNRISLEKKSDMVIVFNIFNRIINQKISIIKEKIKNKSNNTDILLSNKEYLKQIETLFLQKKKEWFEKNVNKKDFTIYVLYELTFDDRNYYYIKRILEENPYMFENNEVAHKLFDYLIDEFIHNSKLRNVNQGLKYTNPQYIKALIKLFLCYINDIDIFDRLEKYKELLLEGNKPSDLKNQTLNDIDEIINYVNSKNKEYDMDIKSLSRQIDMIIYDGLSRFKDKDTVNAFTINGRYAYTISYNDEGDTYFDIHMLDTSSMITPNQDLDDKLKNIELNGYHVLNKIKFKKDETSKEENKTTYPVITFRFRIYKNNTIGNMKMFKSFIQIDEKYSYEQLFNYRNYPDLKEFISAMKRFMIINPDIGIEISERWVEKVISRNVVKLFEEIDIPFVYKRPLIQSVDDLKEENHYRVCTLLHRIEKRKAHMIFNILDENPKEVYTNYPIEGSHLNLDGLTYTGIYLQRLLKGIIDNNYTAIDSDNNSLEFLKLCREFNKQFGFISDDFFKEEKNKVKK